VLAVTAGDPSIRVTRGAELPGRLSAKREGKQPPLRCGFSPRPHRPAGPLFRPSGIRIRFHQSTNKGSLVK
jgi:hypothetical protein